MEFLYIMLYVLLTIVSVCYWFLHKRYSYWAERGVVHDKPVFFYGNMQSIGRTKRFFQSIFDFYFKYKNQAPFGGFYMLMRRAVVLFDLDLVKHVLIKDFNNFATRGSYYNEHDDPLSAHVGNLVGEKWRKVRSKLTPTFSSGKMKYMYPTMVEVGERFVTVLKELVEQEKSSVERNEAVELEIKDLLARFTTDVIGSVAFGLECNSLKDPYTKFRVMGTKAFTESRHKPVITSLINAFPYISGKLRIKTVCDDISEFFTKVVRDTVAYREREGVQRKDFMNLLIEMKNKNETDGLTMEQLTAQAYVFFIAGFETSSSTMGFAFYELAVNQHIQDKARKEINDVLQQHDNKLSYEALYEMKYLQQIFKETLRKYSIAAILIRQTINDYHVPHTNFVIEKGTIVIIPADAIHRDPDIYPNPELFDPERFSPHEVGKRHSMTWLPFGEGPRNCIGVRFGEMQTLLGFAMLLKNFRFLPAKSTTIPIEIEPKSITLAPRCGIRLKVEAL